MVSAIVLAAGLSSRMGADNKLLLDFKSKPVIFNIVETIIHAGFSEVIVVTGHEEVLVMEALNGLEVHFVSNPVYDQGMTSSIQHGVMAATGTGYMICLSDMVKITTDEYRLIGDAFTQRLLVDPECICLPQYKNEKGNPVVFSSFYKDAILQNELQEGCKNIVQSNTHHLYMIEMNTPHILQDFDYPEDYQKLLPVL